MVSTRRKSYQPTSPGTPSRGDAARSGPTTRLRHASLSDPPVTASPRRSRRASSLTPLEAAESSAGTAQARGHHTKALLERYREEATRTLKAVEEEATPTEEATSAPVRKASAKEVAPAEKTAEDVGQAKPEEPRLTEDGAYSKKMAATEEVVHSGGKEERTDMKTNEDTRESAEADGAPDDNERVAPPETSSGAASGRADETTIERVSSDADADTLDAEVMSEEVSQPVKELVSREGTDDDADAAMEVTDEGDEEVDVETVEANVEDDAAARRAAAVQRVLASVAEAPSAAPAPVSAPTVPALTRIRLPPKPRGLAKSGRFWKAVRTPASGVVVRDSVSYEERMRKRQQQRVVKDLENQLKNERKQKLEELRKRREYNAKRATENALKAEVYQVVKNPNKIKRMKKKQLRLLQKRDTTVVGKSVLDE